MHVGSNAAACGFFFRGGGVKGKAFYVIGFRYKIGDVLILRGAEILSGNMLCPNLNSCDLELYTI